LEKSETSNFNNKNKTLKCWNCSAKLISNYSQEYRLCFSSDKFSFSTCPHCSF